ncbi:MULTISPECIES: hypothetical protein [unclassified Lacrimispora]|uniref:hypothetical protein n=1 Tax=unclassified Lacrimispora TaxID=2719232 RepID=UPI0037705424
MERKQRKAKRLIVIAGAVVLLGLSASGCSKKTSEPAETIQVETTVDPEEKFKVDIPLEIDDPTKVVETLEDGGTISTYASGETVYSTGRYGDLGKEVFENLAGAWVKGYIEDEASLRETMDLTYGNLNTKEELTQEILAMTRETQPTQVAKETKPSTENKTEIGKSQGNTKHAQPPQQQTPPVNSSTQSTESAVSPDWTPEMEAEMQRRLQEAKDHPAQVEERGGGDKMDWDPDEAAGQWNWD